MMQLKYWKNICQAGDSMHKVCSISWSTSGKKLAICLADRVIYLYNEIGEKKDKFPTKPAEKSQKAYVIRAIEFSPDSQRIAIAQSDNIVFVYKIGTEWGDRKSICNKFPTSSSVTTLIWPRERNEIVFGLAEGKVKMGILRNNKSQVLYSTDSYVISLASKRDGEGFISGHLDGSIYLFYFDSQNYQKIINHHSIPYCLGWGNQIVAAGNDAKVSFYDHSGNFMQRFDYTNDDKIREFSVASFNSSGDTVVLGNFNRFYVYSFNKKRTQWEETGVKNIENYYTVTAICWKNDGSKLATGSLCGSLDIFEASMKKIIYQGKFEFNYVSPSQMVIKTLSTGDRMVIKTETSPEIVKTNICKNKFVVANTYNSLLLGDLETHKQSEIAWKGSGNEKFDFTNPNVCMIYNAGELTLIEYGNNNPLGTCRTEYVKPSLISARLNYSSSEKNEDSSKVLAFLLDQLTICIQDLNKNTAVAHINHDVKIEFLELNAHANKVLFMDKRRQLYLYNIKGQVKNTLLNYCNYAQWIPDSEVVVAQNRNNLCVWYSIENTDKVTIYNIKGEVDGIERISGKTEVMVNEGTNTVAYTLDEPLIEFGFSIESRNLEKAASILDPLDLNPETEANWKTLAQIAVEEQNINVAEHCYAALGDICKASYLRKINKMIAKYQKETGKKDGLNHYEVQAKLYTLEKQFHQAEALLLDHNEVDKAMEMYQDLHKWDESIKIAVKKNRSDVKEIKANYYQWLLDSQQEAKAAELKENEGDFLQAINLYLKGGLPAKAANIIFNYDISFPQEVLEKIATALSQAGMFEKAGEFYEQMGMLQKALDCYCKGNAYGKAVDLSKKEEPRLVVTLEEKWGDWLVSQKKTENAVNHYIEAGAFQKAIEASISARDWAKAVQMVSSQSPEVARPFYKQIAKHYADYRQLDLAEKYYLKAGLPVEIFEVYTKHGKWDAALKIAKDNLPESEIVTLYAKQAQKCDLEGRYKEAEKLFLTVDHIDLAIVMYKKAAQFDNMIRLVSKYRKHLLKETHLSIAQKFDREGNLKVAEHHYIESGSWQGAVEMYKGHLLWEDAIRVCRLNGSDKETCELAKLWAETLGPEGMEILMKMNLVGAVIEYMTDRNEFEDAFKMAKQHAKHLIPDVHLKCALYYEDEKRYKDAEDHFIKAGKPSEAINMYEAQANFEAALQVARQYEPQSVQNIYMNKAAYHQERREWNLAENCYISARKPEIAIKMFLDLGNYQDGIRVAKKHAPNLVGDLLNRQMTQGKSLSGEEILNSARLSEESRDYSKAIDTYLDLTKEHFRNNDDLLEEAWERAVQLAMNFDKGRYQEVTRVVCKKLKEIGRFEPAAELYENIGLYEDAVATYVQGDMFEKAKDTATQIKNPEINRKIMDYINDRFSKHLINTSQANELVNQGNMRDVITGLDMMIKRGEWKQCLESASKSGPEVLNKYLMRYAKITMESGRFGETISSFAKYGIQANVQNYPIYKTLILEIFVECDKSEVQLLRTTLFNFYKILEVKQELNSPAGKEFSKYLMISHLLNLKSLYEKKDLNNLSTILSISLIRYCDLIRLDKLYLEAGLSARKQNMTSLAITLLNRYLDIYEVIEDQDNNNFGEDDFAISDIPSPFDVPLPEKNLIKEKEKEEIRDWVLSIALNQKVSEQGLPVRVCHVCSTKIYDGSIKCYKCKNVWETCIITGFPLLKNNTVKCRSCNRGGIKEHWNIYLQNFPNCPWCNNIPN